MAVSKKKKWTRQELDKFKTLILEKREVVTAELLEAKEKADEVLNNNSTVTTSLFSKIKVLNFSNSFCVHFFFLLTVIFKSS